MQEAPAPVAHVAREQLVVAHAEDAPGGVVGVHDAAVAVEHEHALAQHLGRDLHAVRECAQLGTLRAQLTAQALGRGDCLRETLTREVERVLGVAPAGLRDLAQRVRDRARNIVGMTPVLLGVGVCDRGSLHLPSHRLAARLT